MDQTPLTGVTVLDLSTTVAGAYAGKLLAGYGAGVVMVEAPTGSPVRSRPPLVDGGNGVAPEGTLFRFLGAGKRSVALDLEAGGVRDALEALARDADVLIDTRQPRELGALPLSYDELREVNPQLVIVSLTPFGLSGPYADYRATALQLAAAGGWLTHSGEPGRPPLMPNSETLEEFFPGTMGAIAAGTPAQRVTLNAQRVFGLDHLRRRIHDVGHVDPHHRHTVAVDTRALAAAVGLVERGPAAVPRVTPVSSACWPPPIEIPISWRSHMRRSCATCRIANDSPTTPSRRSSGAYGSAAITARGTVNQ